MEWGLYEKGILLRLGQCCQCFFCQRQHSKYQPCPQQPAPVRSLFRSTLPQLVGYGLQQLRRDLAGLPLPRQEIFPQRFGVFRLAQLHLSGKENPLLPAETEVCRQYLLPIVFVSSKQAAHFSLCCKGNAAQQPVASPQQPAFRAAVICGKTAGNRLQQVRSRPIFKI
ncbi:unknown [Ruminococcus sp. CAG:330]|nr:unknown [Ruminococcus sp. CAG:330]